MINKKVYIIILNWDGFDDTKKCLDSLMKIDNITINIVVIDNGSKNNEAEKFRQSFPTVKVISNEKNEGFCRGNNQGIHYCLAQDDCGYIMLLNNDTKVRPDFLKPMTRYLEENKKSVVAPMVLNHPNNGRIQALGGGLILGISYKKGSGKSPDNIGKVFEPDFVYGTCFMTTKDAFQDIGMLDEDYFAYLEDLDWSQRAKQSGYRLITITDSVIEHTHSQSTKNSNFKTYLLARNNIYYAKKELVGIIKIRHILINIIIGFIVNLKNPGSLKSFFKGLTDGFKFKIKENGKNR